MYWGSCTVAAIYTNEMETTLPPHLLVYCGLCTAAATYLKLAVHELNYIPVCVLQLVYCRASAVGVDAPQFESFYTIPFFSYKAFATFGVNIKRCFYSYKNLLDRHLKADAKRTRS